MEKLERLKLLSPPTESEPVLESEITVEEAELAAQEAGLSVIRVKRLKASSKIGKFLEQIGAQRVGRTALIVAQDHIETGIEQCDAILANAKKEEIGIDLLLEVVKIRQAYTDQLIKTGMAQMKTDENASVVASKEKSLNLAFPSGSKIAIQTSG